MRFGSPANSEIYTYSYWFFSVCFNFLVGELPSLSLIAKVLFVLFLPGFSILHAIVPDDFDFSERLILSPIIGIAYASLMALYLSTLKVPINQFTIICSILLLSVPLLAYSWKRKTKEKKFKSSITTSTYVILTLLIVRFNFFNIASIPKERHFNTSW